MTHRLTWYRRFRPLSYPFSPRPRPWRCSSRPAAAGTRKEAPKGGTDVPPSQAKIKRNVALTQVREEKLNSFVDTVGYLEAEGQTDIAAGVSGVVDEVLFREGQYVDRDTILVKVDQRRYVTALDVAKANEARALAAVSLEPRAGGVLAASPAPARRRRTRRRSAATCASPRRELQSAARRGRWPSTTSTARRCAPLRRPDQPAPHRARHLPRREDGHRHHRRPERLRLVGWIPEKRRRWCGK